MAANRCVAKFQYTFFDAFGENSKIPDLPITPFPTLFTAPLHRPAHAGQNDDSLELTAAHFFYENPVAGTIEPLDVYLGPIGPLRIRVYQATPLPLGQGHPATVPPFIPNPQAEGFMKFLPSAGTLNATPRTTLVHGPLHTVVIVELPPKGEVLKALEEDALPSNEEATDPTTGRPRSKADRLSGRSLPLLFIRAFDGIGYHSGRAIACEYAFKGMELPAVPAGGDGRDAWVAEQAVQAAENSANSWSYRVI